jgi:Ran GTPase-activating protein (RanGAP) involved in mRNA processing and transport
LDQDPAINAQAPSGRKIKADRWVVVVTGPVRDIVYITAQEDGMADNMVLSSAAAVLLFDEGCQLEQVMETLRFHHRSSSSRMITSTTMDRLTVRNNKFLTDQALYEILALLHENAAVCRIRALHLPSNPSLTSVSVIRLANFIRGGTTLRLRELDLSNNAQAFTIESLSALEDALSSTVNGHVSTTSRVVVALERLDLSGNGLHQRDLRTCLERLLRHNNTIIHLNLSNNLLGSRHLLLLAPGLACNTTIRTLIVSNNPLKDVGVKRLLATSIVDRLTTLDLSLTQCGRTGVSHIYSCLLHNRSIQTLHLSQNNLMGSDGAAYFQAILCHNYTLRELYLSQNNIGNEGMAAIVRGILDSSDYHVTRLTHLDVSSNGLTDASIIGPLIEKSILVHLNLRDNAISDMVPLAAAVHADVSLKYLDVSRNTMTDPSCWIDLLYHGSYTLDVFHYDDNHLDSAQSERLEAALCFWQNEKTWLAKLLRQIETRPRVSLDLTGYQYGDEEIIRIAQALDQYRPVVTKVSLTDVRERAFLSLLGNRRPPPPAAPSSSLRHNHHYHNGTTSTAAKPPYNNIVRLHLSDCHHIGNEGWHELARAINSGSTEGISGSRGDDNNNDHNCPLETLSLLRCRLPQQQPLVLADALRHNTSLKRLCLEANLCFTTADAQAILAAALAHPNLVYLDLANNGLNDDVLVGMPSIRRLRTLMLHNNELTDKGALSLAQSVIGCTSLTWLTLKGNRLTQKGIVSLTMFLGINEILDCND